jgi:uncharacterized protein YjbI with pentapeptide repeats
MRGNNPQPAEAGEIVPPETTAPASGKVVALPDSRKVDLATKDLRGVDLSGQDLSGADLTGCDLSGANLSGTNLKGAKLSFAQLRGSHLFRTNLVAAELLSADLSGADMTECLAERAGFGRANLSDATLISGDFRSATFGNATLCHADLRACNLERARLRSADLTHANFAAANLRQTDFQDSLMAEADFSDTDMRDAHLKGVRGFKSANWLGADIRNVDFCGAYMVRRFIMDENYLSEFRRQNRFTEVLYWLWWVTSDCGRSITRWALWTMAVAFGFAGLYSVTSLDYGQYPTFLSPLYYSFVTLTTLGYGDVVPASPAAQVVAVIEVVVGYVALGGLLSIFATKMARRAE